MRILCGFVAVLQIFIVARTIISTFDINPKQLQMVADHLTLPECRKLSESLHEDGFQRSHDPNGDSEPKGVSCLRLLEHWNTHEGKSQSFHQLALRLKQLGKKDIADRLAESVSNEKIAEVRESFLSDPFKSRIHSNSPLLQESPHVETAPPSQEDQRDWTTFQVVVAIVIAIVMLVIFLLCFVELFKVFLPDSYTRMRSSFYLSFTGKWPTSEKLYFII